jgi:hypothetical protein
MPVCCRVTAIDVSAAFSQTLAHAAMRDVPLAPRAAKRTSEAFAYQEDVPVSSAVAD